MSDTTAFLQAIFSACASNLAPTVGVDLAPGDISAETCAEPPTGDLAVLPLAVEAGGKSLSLTLSVPLTGMAMLARRMLGENDPEDKEAELGEEVLDAIGEVLGLMGGAVDQALRRLCEVGASPGSWWRTDAPDEDQFEEGEFLLGTATLSAPDNPPVPVHLRIPVELLDLAGGANSAGGTLGPFGLLELPEDLRGKIESALAEAGAETVTIECEDPYLMQRCARLSMLIVGSDSGLEFCTKLRMANETWAIPTLLCLSEPTRADVLQALDRGASHVLAVPLADDADLLKVIASAESRANGQASR